MTTFMASKGVPVKLSKIFHVLASVSGFLGVLSLILATYAVVSDEYMVLGIESTFYIIFGFMFVLVAIWLQLATIHHMMLEKKGEII